MTTPTVRTLSAEAIAVLRQLLVAICDARPDGVHVAKALMTSPVQVLLDERTATLSVLVQLADDRVEWLETIVVHPEHEHTFGLLISQRDGARVH